MVIVESCAGDRMRSCLHYISHLAVSGQTINQEPMACELQANVLMFEFIGLNTIYMANDSYAKVSTLGFNFALSSLALTLQWSKTCWHLKNYPHRQGEGWLISQ